MNKLEKLQKALDECYDTPPGNLIHGSALQVEDLQVTMRSVIFTCPTFTDLKRLNRMLKNLNQRNIPYKLTSRKLNKHQLITFSWNKKLKVGKRTFLYRTDR